jgi:hypothetical protein
MCIEKEEIKFSTLLQNLQEINLNQTLKEIKFKQSIKEKINFAD